MKEYYRVWAEIDLDAICNNINKTKDVIQKEVKIMAVIKADAYGHGAVPIAKVLQNKVDAFGIATVEEGIELRRAGIKNPILILGYAQPQLYSLLVEYNIMATVFRYDMAKALSKEAIKQSKKAKIHLKLDTGMGRIGFQLKEESLIEIQKIATLEAIEIDGCFTHFAKADEKDKKDTWIQYEKFQRFVLSLENSGISIPIKHVSNSAGLIDLPEVNLNMVRSGISTYGLYPSNQVSKEHILLEPVMSIKGRISHIKEVEAGTAISYGGTYVTKRKTKVATIPVGYGDGYPRGLSNQAMVLLQGRRVPVIGRICMDQFMIDVTKMEHVEVGDIVTLLGKDGQEHITVEELCKASKLFHYEFVCNIGKRVPRVFYYQNKKVGTLDYYDCINTTYELKRLEYIVGEENKKK